MEEGSTLGNGEAPLSGCPVLCGSHPRSSQPTAAPVPAASLAREGQPLVHTCPGDCRMSVSHLSRA